MGVGAALLARPTTLPKALGVDSVTARKVGWLSPMVGARDLALGAGLVQAARRGSDPRPWLLAAVFADAVDALAFGSATRQGQVGVPGGVVCTGVALGGVLGGLASLRELQEHEASTSA
jgi:hypothetical protein